VKQNERNTVRVAHNSEPAHAFLFAPLHNFAPSTSNQFAARAIYSLHDHCNSTFAARSFEHRQLSLVKIHSGPTMRTLHALSCIAELAHAIYHPTHDLLTWLQTEHTSELLPPSVLWRPPSQAHHGALLTNKRSTRSRLLSVMKTIQITSQWFITRVPHTCTAVTKQRFRHINH